MNEETFSELGKSHDDVYQALCFLGEASEKLSIARTVLFAGNPYKASISKIQEELEKLKYGMRNERRAAGMVEVWSDGDYATFIGLNGADVVGFMSPEGWMTLVNRDLIKGHRYKLIGENNLYIVDELGKRLFVTEHVLNRYFKKEV